jgi:hypothetical protein
VVKLYKEWIRRNVILGVMANYNAVDVTFCRRIAYEEWRNFKLSQDRAIDARLNRQTGLLHSGGAGRRYSISTNKQEIVASLLHPDYERYQDIKRLRHGRTNSRLHTPKITQTKGKGIHNRLIWGRMNTIAFRCINDLRGEVIKYVRSSKIAERKVDFKF